jgi:hypothetical protein
MTCKHKTHLSLIIFDHLATLCNCLGCLISLSLITIIVADGASLGPVHVGRGHKLNVAQLEDSGDDAKHVEHLVAVKPNVLESFL